MKKVYKWNWHPEKYTDNYNPALKHKITREEFDEAKDFILGTFDYYKPDLIEFLKTLSVPTEVDLKVTDNTLEVVVSTDKKFSEEDEDKLDEGMRDTFESDLGAAITKVPFIEEDDTEYYIFIDDYSGVEKAAKVSRLYKLVK